MTGRERLPRIKRATIEDVAREAGVGRQTVSRALRDLPEIAPETRERVLAAATRLGYRPSAPAKGMRTQRSDVIALVVSDIANPFYPAVVPVRRSRDPDLKAVVVTGSLLSIIPLILAFLALQQFWRTGLAAGAVKD